MTLVGQTAWLRKVVNDELATKWKKLSYNNWTFPASSCQDRQRNNMTDVNQDS